MSSSNPPVDKNLKPNGRLKGKPEATIWQEITFNWVSGLIWNYGRVPGKVTPDILSDLTSKDESANLSRKMEEAWEYETQIKRYSLWRVLLKVVGRDYIIAGLIGLVESFLKILQAVFLGHLITFFRNPNQKTSDGLVYAAVISVAVLISGSLHHYFFFGAVRAGFQARVGLIALLFRKALKTSLSSSKSTGEVINMISNDVQPFETGFIFFHYLWIGIIEIAIIFYFLWGYIGISSVVAIGLYSLVIPFQSYLSTLFTKIRGITVNFRDKRIKLTSDVLGGIEIVKLNTWEDPLKDKISETRDREYRSLRNAASFKGLNLSVFLISGQVVQMFTFITLWFIVVQGLGSNIGNVQNFSPQNIFPAVGLLAITKQTMTGFIPKALECFGEARISVKRITAFLLLPSAKPILEVEESVDSTDSNENGSNQSFSGGEKNKDLNTIISFKNASFMWRNNEAEEFAKKTLENKGTPKNQKHEKLTTIPTEAEIQKDKNDMDSPRGGHLVILKNINLDIKHGELHAIVGSVGSGKSSLCQAILDEMHLISGSKKLFIKPKQKLIPTETPETSQDGTNISGQMEVENDGNHSPVAYAAQSPWIFAGTVRENILFGKEYDSEWFNTVVNACSLNNDFKQFESGEFTVIGERGTNLSGGQRARVALARAIYQKADLYILDDPLSAVDPKVGRQLFDEVVCKLLKGKTVILATHQLQFISGCDKVSVMENGMIIESGRPDEINMLKVYNEDENNFESAGQSGIQTPYEQKDVIDPENLLDLNLDDSALKSLNLEHVPEFDRASVRSLLLDLNEVSEEVPETKKSIKRIIIEKKNTSNVHSEKPSSEKNNKESDKDKKGENDYVVGESEDMEIATTPLSTYFRFFRYGYSYPVIAFGLFLTLLQQGVMMGADYILARWSSIPPGSQHNVKYVYTYCILVIVSAIAALVSINFLMKIMLAASNGLLLSMLKSVIKSPLAFFQSQPQGRVLNRFSKDQSNIDELLPATILDTVLCVNQIIGAMIFVCMANIYLLITVPIVSGAFIWLRNIYMSTSRQVKRIESVTRSPVYATLSETLDGITTVRAFSAHKQVLDSFIESQNENSRAYFAFLGAARWLGIRLDFATSVFIAAAAFSMIAVRSKINPGLVALSMSYVLTLVGMVQWCVRQSIEVEIIFISVERNFAYTKLTPEESSEILDHTSPVPKEWPQNGQINVENLNLKYSSSAAPVLNNLTFNIKSGEKIGIVGRTGAGKSSLVSCFFRLAEPYPNGCITIDNINISNITLHDLRSNLSMIPQQPFLFEGTLRFNLDPWNSYSDEEIWNALEAAKLKTSIEKLPNLLESEVTENGKNFSTGERQLVSLCRAILANRQIVVMDEATANVDLFTDKQIQQSIHTHFKKATVLTIAHRLHTVIGEGYDRIIVLDHGKLVEIGEPHELLENRSSRLSQMVAETGPVMEEQLRKLAYNQFNMKQSQK
ncbi:hypothetical protein BB559_004083 [Furculomyces boomerangus]|uniref:P-loop containing nucleoside triphosphate hydrolase protein n=1 Tax=Furculomyces boomerangus TaxID=61424 RepID=A0A2T9YGR9_9FUNG|nr:hypothetical protein BB559_004083 [Furculomyces boomerangus]